MYLSRFRLDAYSDSLLYRMGAPRYCRCSYRC
nr:MAG TPA: hypothetical protein [Caudoviricetes sp.]